MWVVALFAQADRADKDPFRQPEVIWGTAGLALALLGGALIIWLVDRWRKQATTITPANTAEELTDFRGMYERGEITEEEYVRLRNKVSGSRPPAPHPADRPRLSPPRRRWRDPRRIRRRPRESPIPTGVQNRQGRADKRSGLRLI
jgi:hypothetical protein